MGDYKIVITGRNVVTKFYYRILLYNVELLTDRCRCAGGRFEIRKQRDEHQTIQLFTAPVLVTELHGRVHLVVAVRRRKG